MGIRKYKPTTPGRRGATVSDFADLTPGAKPAKKLTRPKRRTSGRNNQGKITVRHRGGGHKRKLRVVDFARKKDGVLLSGDAVVTKADPLSMLVGKRADVCGPPGYFTWHQPLARESIALLAKLKPRVLAGGHGEPRRDERLVDKLKSLAKGD